MVARLAQPTDAAELASLNRDFNDSAISAQQISDYLADCPEDEKTVVAEVDGEIVGLGCLQIHHSWCYPEPWAELTELFVRPDYRRRGLGQSVIRVLESLAADAGATEITLLTNKANSAGQSLYRKCGYAEVAESVFRK
jgi:ribosomal protein S18 acetylase RimI-like enzyme